MKKFFTYTTTIICSFLMMATFTSCDRAGYWDYENSTDRHEAYTLDGTWTGYIETYFRDRWGVTGNTYRTTMEFFRDNAYGGTGREIDYNTYDNYVYYYCDFTWDVYNGVIRIRYADSPGNIVRIYDYALSANYFDGYMDDGTSRGIRFRLNYDGNFNWETWYTYYSRQNNADWSVDTDSTKIQVPLK